MVVSVKEVRDSFVIHYNSRQQGIIETFKAEN